MGIGRKIGLGIVGVVLAGASLFSSGCATTSPIEKYQAHKAGVEHKYNQEAGKRTNQAKKEYGPALDKEKVQEAEKLSKDLRKNDDQLIAEMVKNAEEKRKYDQKAQELEKRLDGTYSLNQMFTYSNKEPSKLRAGVSVFTAEQDSEREKPRKRTGWRAEVGYDFDNGLGVSYVHENDTDTQSVANDAAFANMTSTGDTHGIQLRYVFKLGKGITVEPYVEGGVRVERNRTTGAFYGSGASIRDSNTQSIAYGGAGLGAGVDLGKGWKFVAGVGGKKYEGGETRTTSRNALDELEGFVGFTWGGN